jgi:hypothetical protein
MPYQISANHWVERNDNAIFEYFGRRFIVAFERDTSGVTPDTCNACEPISPAHRESWERGEWHFLTIRAALIGNSLSPLRTRSSDAGRTRSGVPSFDNLPLITERLCAEIIEPRIFPLGTLPGERRIFDPAKMRFLARLTSPHPPTNPLFPSSPFYGPAIAPITCSIAESNLHAEILEAIGHSGACVTCALDQLVMVLCSRIEQGDKSAGAELYRLMQGFCFSGVLTTSALQTLATEMDTLLINSSSVGIHNA